MAPAKASAATKTPSKRTKAPPSKAMPGEDRNATKTAAKKNGGNAAYGAVAHESVRQATEEMNEGKLRSSSGQKVTNRKQAVAIGLSEARRSGVKVPPKPGE